MKNDTKQVIILNKFSSPEIQQAIIILKNPHTENETGIVQEAERVIDEYLKSRRSGVCVEDKKAGAILAGVIALGMIITGLAVYAIIHLAGGTL